MMVPTSITTSCGSSSRVMMMTITTTIAEVLIRRRDTEWFVILILLLKYHQSNRRSQYTYINPSTVTDTPTSVVSWMDTPGCFPGCTGTSTVVVIEYRLQMPVSRVSGGGNRCDTVGHMIERRQVPSRGWGRTILGSVWIIPTNIEIHTFVKHAE